MQEFLSSRLQTTASTARTSGQGAWGSGTEQDLAFFSLASVAMEIHAIGGVVAMPEPQ